MELELEGGYALPPTADPVPDRTGNSASNANLNLNLPLIHDHVANREIYRRLGPLVGVGLDYLAAFDPDTPDGRYELRGDDLFALVQSYDTTPGAEKRFESHRRYIDLQYMAAGRERILHAPVETLEVETPYDEEKDITFHAEPGASSSILVRPGEVVILFPHDGHKPGCMAGGREAVKKVVVKARVPETGGTRPA